MPDENCRKGRESQKEASYPSYDLESCIKFSEVIKGLGGSKGDVKKSLIAKQVKLAESTPSFFQRLGASKAYGIIEGWGAYSLTELGKNWFYPTSEQAHLQAGLSMFASPKAFRLLVERFNGEKLPNLEMIGNILHQDGGVPESWKDRLATIFIRSATYLGIIDDEGVLRYVVAREANDSTAIANADGDQQDSAVPAFLPVAPQPQQSQERTARPGNTVWTFPFQGSYIRLETPENLSKALWEKLDAYVKILRPSDPESKEETSE